MKTELLSPAGDIEAAYSAFYFGADAVYLGLRRFSARAEAINFSPEDLDEITAYAHANGKKVYVAINTLMQENELPELMTHLQVCADCRVDALIVQDIGVARIVKKAFPSLVLHGSTQMAVHNLSGALALKNWVLNALFWHGNYRCPKFVKYSRNPVWKWKSLSTAHCVIHTVVFVIFHQ